MTAAPPSQPPATLIDHDEMATRIQQSLLALATYAMAVAERLIQQAGVTNSNRLLAWLFPGRARRRGRRFRTMARTLHALAAMLEPKPHQTDACEDSVPDDDVTLAAPEPFTFTFEFAGSQACRPPESPSPPLFVRPSHPAGLRRPTLRRRTLPPRPRLLPPQQAAPRAAPRRQAA